jgi:sigma-54-specific transcriptional regulator
LVAATNVDLANAVTAGNFRLDLFYRLNVANFILPPLRERKGDILPLVEYFVGVYCDRLQLTPPALPAETKNALLNYSWPGNIRELENVVHVALLVATDNIIRPDNLRFSAMPIASLSANHNTPIENIAAQLDRLLLSPPPDLYRQLEELIIKHAFHYSADNQVHTARLLGVSRNSLRTQLKHFGLIGNEVAVG